MILKLLSVVAQNICHHFKNRKTLVRFVKYFKLIIMKFIVSSTNLLHGLLSASKVLVSKNSFPILDYFLFNLKENSLTVTASDSETTLKTIINIDEVAQEGRIAVSARLLTETLKELPTQPIELCTSEERNIVNVIWASGSAQIPYLPADEYPELPEIADYNTIKMKGGTLNSGINSTFYATGDEELRPVMNGIFFDLTTDSITLVASNAHKLVYYTRLDIKGETPSSFIIPKKPANLLKNNLGKFEDEEVEILFNKTTAHFKFGSFFMACRLVEGNYPAYKTVIPKNNTNLLVITRSELLNACKRVAVCSNQATGQLVFRLMQNQLDLSAQDTDFSMSAHETMSCEYDGTPMEIGFKSTFLIEILSNLTYDQICIKLADPSRAVLIQPVVQAEPEEEICALLMPMRINN